MKRRAFSAFMAAAMLMTAMPGGTMTVSFAEDVLPVEEGVSDEMLPVLEEPVPGEGEAQTSDEAWFFDDHELLSDEVVPADALLSDEDLSGTEFISEEDLPGAEFISGEDLPGEELLSVDEPFDEEQPSEAELLTDADHQPSEADFLPDETGLIQDELITDEAVLAAGADAASLGYRLDTQVIFKTIPDAPYEVLPGESVVVKATLINDFSPDKPCPSLTSCQWQMLHNYWDEYGGHHIDVMSDADTARYFTMSGTDTDTVTLTSTGVSWNERGSIYLQAVVDFSDQGQTYSLSSAQAGMPLVPVSELYVIRLFDEQGSEVDPENAGLDLSPENEMVVTPVLYHCDSVDGSGNPIFTKVSDSVFRWQLEDTRIAITSPDNSVNYGADNVSSESGMAVRIVRPAQADGCPSFRVIAKDPNYFRSDEAASRLVTLCNYEATDFAYAAALEADGQMHTVNNPAGAGGSFIFRVRVPETGLYQFVGKNADVSTPSGESRGGYNPGTGDSSCYTILKKGVVYKAVATARERTDSSGNVRYPDTISMSLRKCPLIDDVSYIIPDDATPQNFEEKIKKRITYTADDGAHTFEVPLNDYFARDGIYYFETSYGLFDRSGRQINYTPTAEVPYGLKTYCAFDLPSLGSGVYNEENCWLDGPSILLKMSGNTDYTRMGEATADAKVHQISNPDQKANDYVYWLEVPETGFYQTVGQNADVLIEGCGEARGGYFPESGLFTGYCRLQKGQICPIRVTIRERTDENGSNPRYPDSASFYIQRYPENIRIEYLIPDQVSVNGYEQAITRKITYTAGGKTISVRKPLSESPVRDGKYLFEYQYGLFTENGAAVSQPKADTDYILKTYVAYDLFNWGKAAYSEAGCWSAPQKVRFAGGQASGQAAVMVDMGVLPADGQEHTVSTPDGAARAYRYQLTVPETGLYQFVTTNAMAGVNAGEGRGGYDPYRGQGTAYAILQAGQTYEVTLTPREVETVDEVRYEQTAGIRAQKCPVIDDVEYVIPAETTTDNYSSSIIKRITYTDATGSHTFDSLLEDIPAVDGSAVFELGYGLFDENGSQVADPVYGTEYTLKLIDGYDLAGFGNRPYDEANCPVWPQKVTLGKPLYDDELEDILQDETKTPAEKANAVIAISNRQLQQAVDGGSTLMQQVSALENEILAAGGVNGVSITAPTVSGDDGASVTGTVFTVLKIAGGLAGAADAQYHAELAFAKQNLSRNKANELMYRTDISLHVKDGNDMTVAAGVQPAAPLTITMTIPEAFAGIPVAVYHHVPAGNGSAPCKELVPFEQEGSRITFTTYGLSTFSVETACSHVWNGGKITKVATCEKTGEKLLTCTVCGAEKTEVVAAAGHRWGSWTSESAATISAKAVRKRICSACRKVQRESYGALASPFIKVTDSTIILKQGQTTKAFKVSMAAGDTVTKWTVKDKKVASVKGKKDGTCTIKGLKAGKSTKLTITLASKKKKTVTIRVQKQKVAVKSVSHSPKTIKIKAGETYKLKPVIKPFTCTDKAVYTSKNTKVVTVGKKNGIIKAGKKAKGKTAKVVIKADKKSCTVTVRVI